MNIILNLNEFQDLKDKIEELVIALNNLKEVLHSHAENKSSESIVFTIDLNAILNIANTTHTAV